MERHGFAMEIKKGQTLKFRNALGAIWKDLTAFLDAKWQKCKKKFIYSFDK